jgi:hypothetical protein
MKQSQTSFMEQFPAARAEVARLKRFMGESAKLAVLTFPTAPLEGKALERGVSRRKKAP